MAQIYLIRHGQASFGSQNYDQLSDLGLEQAQILGRWWAARDLSSTRIVSGKMQRHLQTARACIAQLQGMPETQLNSEDWHSDFGFNEYNHHEVLARHVPAFDDPAEVKKFLMNTPDGKSAFQEIFSQAIARWMSGHFDHDYAETWASFRQPGGTISALCQHVLGFSDARFAELNWSLVNSGVTRFHLQPALSAEQPAKLALAYLNNFSHLEQLNRSELISYV
ncbi:MAG: phosphoglycerate mutase family protein [Burkholderiales bacterium]|nr:phosphoglycerate mutase family protein [Burkholderiales bacterium]